jgi:hypothetical protein
LGHILWSCQSAKDVWIEFSPIHKCTSDEVDFTLVVEKLMARLDDNQMHLVAMVARQIWLRRNLVIFGGEFLDLASVMRRAKAQEDVVLVAEQCHSGREVVPKALVNVRRLKLPWGTVKANWDAAVDNQQGSWGVQHAHRTANKSSHRFAKLALTMDENGIWRGDFPSCIRDYMCTES